jgi:hypothetical protein
MGLCFVAVERFQGGPILTIRDLKLKRAAASTSPGVNVMILNVFGKIIGGKKLALLTQNTTSLRRKLIKTFVFREERQFR